MGPGTASRAGCNVSHPLTGLEVGTIGGGTTLTTTRAWIESMN